MIREKKSYFQEMFEKIITNQVNVNTCLPKGMCVFCHLVLWSFCLD